MTGLSTMRSPPQAPPLFNYTPETLATRTEQLITRQKEATDTIAKEVAPDQAQFTNVLLPLAQVDAETDLEARVTQFVQYVSTDAALRDASSASEQKMNDFYIETAMREDIFKLVEATYNKQKDDSTLDAESRHLLKKRYKGSIYNGLGLPPSERARFKEIAKRLSELSISFSKNLNEENGGLWFKPEELRGVPNDVLDTLAKGDKGSKNEGKLKVSFKYPDIIPTQKYCSVPETRKKLFIANENKCNQNGAIFQEALVLRDEAARLLGYPDHATLIIEDKMAKTPKTVNDFLGDLRKRLAEGGQKELEKLKELKRNDPDSVDRDRYYIWDHRYYDTLMLSKDFQLDQNQISEYFPLQTCIAGMLNIFEELFGLEFVKIEGKDRDAISTTGKGEDIVWHPDVQLFAVWDTPEEGAGSDSGFVGYLYLDLHPRDGKYGHAANFNLQPGFATTPGQERRYPATALVCNFSKPTPTKPSLLKHDEVVTLFHELGHGIHDLVAQTTYSSFHGTSVARDFVEAPSQMLENWCWTPSQIESLSKHWSYLSPEYKKAYTESASGTDATQPEEKMPDSMIDSIIRTRHVNDALANLRQLHFGIFDMTVHQPKSHEEVLKLDAAKLYNQIRHELSKLDDLGDTDDYHWANGAATFGHLMGGYDAGYYGYLSSQVYSTDMFYTAFSKDPMNKEAGRRYRNTVLKRGGSRDEMELLKEFLGREPSTEPFYKELGVA